MAVLPIGAAHRANTQQDPLFRTKREAKRLERCCPGLRPWASRGSHLGRDVEVHW